MRLDPGDILPDASATECEFYRQLNGFMVYHIKHLVQIADTRHGSRLEFEPELVENERVAVLKRGLEVAEKRTLFRRRMTYEEWESGM